MKKAIITILIIIAVLAIGHIDYNDRADRCNYMQKYYNASDSYTISECVKVGVVLSN